MLLATPSLSRVDTATDYEVTASNSDWRGPYIYHMWEDQSTGGVGAGFAHGYRDNGVISGTAGGTDWAVLEINYATWADMSAENPTWADLEAVAA